jgi:DNA-binding transcriptional LysR family regulator
MPVDPGYTFRQLEQFLAVSETGGFAPAAARLHLTPNAVAQSVTELERVLGVALTVRRRARGVSLTPSGVRFADRARALLQDAAELTRSVGEREDAPPAGPVTIGCYAPLAPVLLPRLWDRVRRDLPAVDLQLQEGSTAELVRMLEQGALDLALTYAVGLPAQVDSRPLHSLGPKVSLPGDHPLASHASVDLADLADLPLVLLDQTPSAENTINVLRRRGLAPPVAHRVRDVELMRSLVARGAGFALHFSDPGSEVSREGLPVACLPVAPATEVETVVLAWHRGVPLPRRVRSLAEACTAEFGLP